MHIVDLDSVWLITPEIENGLTAVLRQRLDQVRKEEALSTGAKQSSTARLASVAPRSDFQLLEAVGFA